jgi:glycosyltransferase involved in cell wall biosynthesis
MTLHVEVRDVAAPVAPAPGGSEVLPITIVVPCFNEEEGLPHLARRLREVATDFGARHPLSVILVDDGSTDATWQVMQRHFGGDPAVTCLRHEANRGIAAASLTGILAARDEAVAVIDSDCTYDPALILDMVPLLAPEVSVVTASPYHALGQVAGVPRWRVFLSYGASLSYRVLFRNKLATYTSCFRLYRRSAVASLPIRNGGFIGVTEKLALLDREGWTIREVPARLEMRRYGQSKLQIRRAIIGHLGLMSEIALARMRRQWTPRGDQVTE